MNATSAVGRTLIARELDASPTSNPVVSTGARAACDTTERVGSSGRPWSFGLRCVAGLAMVGALAACGGGKGKDVVAAGVAASAPVTIAVCTPEQLAEARRPAESLLADVRGQLATAQGAAAESEATITGRTEALTAAEARVATQQQLLDSAVDKTLGAEGSYNARPRLKALQAQLAKLSDDDRSKLVAQVTEAAAGKYGFALQTVDVAAAQAAAEKASASAATADETPAKLPVVTELLDSDTVLGELVTRGRIYAGRTVEASGGVNVVEKSLATEILSVDDLRAWLAAFKKN